MITPQKNFENKVGTFLRNQDGMKRKIPRFCFTKTVTKIKLIKIKT